MQTGALGEIGRVREHLRGAEALLDARSLAGLDPAQRLTRQLLRAELARYRDEGLFPKNRDFPGERRPYFIDTEGTRCAMAHLMELGGAAALVAEIAAASNNAYVEELANDPRVVAWLRAAGLTVEEAARIQPEYCLSETPARCVCILARGTPDAGTELVYEGTVLSAGDVGGAIARIDAVHGGSDPVSHVGTERAVQKGTRPLSPGERILAVGSSATVAHQDIPVAALEHGDTLGTICLFPGDFPPLPSLSKAEAIALIDGTDSECRDALIARDPAWGVDDCQNRQKADAALPAPDASVTSGDSGDAGAGTASPSTPSESDGCNLAASSHESLTVLAAVIAALAVRRWALRPRAARGTFRSAADASPASSRGGGGSRSRTCSRG